MEQDDIEFLLHEIVTVAPRPDQRFIDGEAFVTLRLCFRVAEDPPHSAMHPDWIGERGIFMVDADRL